jgi:RNAse (barnase) inhibitor barstar
MKIEGLKNVVQPWVVKTIGNIEFLIDRLQEQIGEENLFILNGLNMKTYNDLYDEFANVLKFPDYFGRNLNALDECINDLEWLNNNIIIIVVANSNFVLCEENDAGCETIIEIFENAGSEWSKPVESGEQWDRDALPFHAVIHAEKEGVKSIDVLPELKLQGDTH